nr:hypothetical protein [Cytophagaceae bacterium]
MTEIIAKVETLQNLLVAIATGGSGEEEVYKSLRTEFLGNNEIKKYLPDFMQTNRTTGQFWQYIKYKFPTYAERRNYIWAEFSNVLDYLEKAKNGIIEESTQKSLDKFNQQYINSEWLKALERKSDD